jgi:hypothetical protein
MPVFILTAIGYVRGSKAAQWTLVAIGAALLCWAAVAAFRAWVANGKDEAVSLSQKDVTIEAANLVINASSAATANQMERDDAFANSQEELRDEVATKGTADPVGPATASVLERMRQQQAAGRRGANTSR